MNIKAKGESKFGSLLLLSGLYHLRRDRGLRTLTRSERAGGRNAASESACNQIKPELQHSPVSVHPAWVNLFQFGWRRLSC